MASLFDVSPVCGLAGNLEENGAAAMEGP